MVPREWPMLRFLNRPMYAFFLYENNKFFFFHRDTCPLIFKSANGIFREYLVFGSIYSTPPFILSYKDKIIKNSTSLYTLPPHQIK